MSTVLTNSGLVSHLNAYARQRLRTGLSMLTETHVKTFKMMYWPDGGYERFSDPEDMDLDRIINGMPLSKLDWALSQTENSLQKLGLHLPPRWNQHSAAAAARAIGFSGTLWTISAEELAALLNKAAP
jgi:hypothetical protein